MKQMVIVFLVLGGWCDGVGYPLRLLTYLGDNFVMNYFENALAFKLDMSNHLDSQVEKNLYMKNEESSIRFYIFEPVGIRSNFFFLIHCIFFPLSDSTSANCAYDVYCFGKVLLELVTGKLGLSASTDAESKEWLEQTLPYINVNDKELVTKILDPLLIVDEDLLEEVWAMAIIARSCLNPKASRRPPMRYILRALENPLKIVREDNNSGSGRLRATSSRGSWNAALFGSWRHSSSDAAVIPAASSATIATREAAGATGSFKQSGATGSQGSGPNNGSSSHRRHSKEIFPEPQDPQDIERQD